MIFSSSIHLPKLHIPKIQFTDHMKLKKKEDQSVGASVLLRRGTKYRIICGDKVWSRDWRKGHPETVPPRDPFHLHTPNLDTMSDAKKCLLTGACYSCSLRGSARASPIQKWMHLAKHQTESMGIPVEKLGKDCRSWRGLQLHRKSTNINQPDPLKPPRTKPPTKEYTWRYHGSS